MNTKHPVLKWIMIYTVITIGCAIYSLGFNAFFMPNNLAMGGFTGIAQIINRLVPFMPIGTTALLMNVPLLIMGTRKEGLKLLMGTLFATTVSNLLIDGLAALVTFPSMDPLLATLYGGVMVGLSMGILMRVSATTGGTELEAKLLKYKFHQISIGKICMTIDIIVIIVYALTFRNFNPALYGIVAMYISGLVMDMVVYGSGNAKLAYIISDHSTAIAKKLLDMDLGLTLLDGRGAYTGNEKKVVLCAFKRNHIVPVKAAVTAIDPDAFIIVCEAHEVLGEGFGYYTPESV